MDESKSGSGHPGLRLNSRASYDLMVWLFTRGRPRALREAMLRPARLKSGERVLDIGCGTGSLALLTKEQVGPAGEVHGVDASTQMIDYARRKAAKARAGVRFDVAPAQELPYPDSSFDVVLTTLAIHHLPKPGREKLFREMRRVLKPGGRALAVDFAESSKGPHGLPRLLSPRHGSVAPDEIARPMQITGLEIVESRPLGRNKLHYVLAQAPGDLDQMIRPSADVYIPEAKASRRPAALVVAALVAFLLMHLLAGASIADAIMRKVSGSGWLPAAIVIGLLLLMKASWAIWFAHRRKRA